MSLKSINILVFLILYGISFGITEAQDPDFEHINSLISYANKLVREKNYKNAAYFYENVFQYIDSVELSDTTDEKKLDQLKELASNHYFNFERIVKELDICFDPEDKIFGFDKKDFDLFSDGSEDFKCEPFPDKQLKSVDRWIEKYSKKNRSTFQAYLNNSQRYAEDMKKVFRHFGLPEELAYIPMAESGFSPFAHSYSKAAGLWQFIQSTAKMFGLSSNWWEDERKHVLKSTIAAARYYKYLYSRLGDWNLVVAAYNCGPGRVNNSVKKHKSDNFWSLHSLPKETRDYVPRVRALMTIAKDPEKYGFTSEKNIAVHDTVMLDSCVSLNAVAKALNISYSEIKLLNPQLRQWVLPPYAKNYSLIIPADSKVKFREKFRAMDPAEIYPVAEYTVKKGDTLNKIANKFKVNSASILDMNPEDIEFREGSKIKLLKPPVDQKWFTDFNNRHLTFYDEEEYFLEGRKKVSYTVRKGDSVWSISRKLKVGSEKLKSWNKIGKNNIVRPGQVLIAYF
jgi:membrane-bound lytic murein transglycosylase D